MTLPPLPDAESLNPKELLIKQITEIQGKVLELLRTIPERLQYAPAFENSLTAKDIAAYLGGWATYYCNVFVMGNRIERLKDDDKFQWVFVGKFEEMNWRQTYNTLLRNGNGVITRMSNATEERLNQQIWSEHTETMMHLMNEHLARLNKYILILQNYLDSLPTNDSNEP